MTSPLAIAPVIKRSITVDHQKTSLSLEEPFWQRLQHIARRDKTSIAAIIKSISFHRPGNLSSAVRQLVLADALAVATQRAEP